MKSQPQKAPSGITVGELCQAIGERRIPSERRDDTYVLRGSDVRRLARTGGGARSVAAAHHRRPAC